MGLRISSNIASEQVQKNLKMTSASSDQEMEKLSSGKRITKAADDAAGLAISTHLEAQTRGLKQATRNANDAVSWVQTAEGGLNETTNILVRLRELTIQSASDTVGDTERSFLNNEYQQLIAEADRIADSTTFNGAHLLNGDASSGSLDFHVGAQNGEYNKIRFDPSMTNAKSDNIGIAGTGIGNKEDALSSIDGIDTAINSISGQRASLGAIQSRLHATVRNLEVQTINQDSARSVMQDVDVADSTAKLASANVLKNAGIATLAQANQIPNAALRLIG